MTGSTKRIRVWDLPTRIFHWAVAALVVFSFTTGRIGGDWMAWHLRSGYAILALILFRIAWGFVGSETARFASFLRGPRAAFAYGRGLLSGHHPFTPGHNPLGGWMVAALLIALALQAATGLFADDEIATQGPLAVKVSNHTVGRMSAIHSWWQWGVVALVVLHVAAIATYRWKWKVPLAGRMLHGWMEGPRDATEPRLRPAWLAAALLAACALAVYVLVAIVPMR